MSSPELSSLIDTSSNSFYSQNPDHSPFSYTKAIPEILEQFNESHLAFQQLLDNPKENLPIIANESAILRDVSRYTYWKHYSGDLAQLPKAQRGEEKQVLLLPGLGGSALHYLELASVLKLGGHIVEHGYPYNKINRFSWEILDQIKDKTLRMIDKNQGEQITVNAHSKGCIDALVVGKMIEEEEGAYPYNMHIFHEGPISPVLDTDYPESDTSPVLKLMETQMERAGTRDGASLTEVYLWALGKEHPEASILSIAIPNDPIVPYESSIPHPNEGICYDITDTTHILGPYNPKAIKLSMEALAQGPGFIKQQMEISLPLLTKSSTALREGEEITLPSAA